MVETRVLWAGSKQVAQKVGPAGLRTDRKSLVGVYIKFKFNQRVLKIVHIVIKLNNPKNMSLRFLLGAMLLALATAVNMDDCAVGNVNDRLRAGAASRHTSGRPPVHKVPPRRVPMRPQRTKGASPERIIGP